MVHGPASQIALLLQLREQHGKAVALEVKVQSKGICWVTQNFFLNYEE